MYNNIGLVLYNKGDLDGALEQHQRALAIKEVKNPNSWDVANSYNNTGNVLFQKRDIGRAFEQH